MPTITDRLAEADLALFHRWAATHSRPADQVLPRLTKAANNSRLWFAVAGAVAAAGGERGRRAASRGVASIAVTSALANGPAKWAFRRRRPPIERVPLGRRLTRQPTSASFPSGHSASAAAFATAVGMEWPALGLPLAVAATGVAWSRVHTGVHYPSDVAVGLGIGVAAALLVRRRWPAVPPAPATRFTPAPAPASADGAGVVAVVNPASGGTVEPAELRRLLPAAEVVELAEGTDPEDALERAAGSGAILAVAGGDGTVSAAARVAAEQGRPLLVLPCGTLNHFARQLGMETIDDALAALATGTAAVVDLGDADGETFVNTSSLGSYPQMVARRERLERALGKWPAMLAALTWTLIADEPLELTVDGRRTKVWLLFCGNGRCAPPGLAPTWRPCLDSGVLDVRLISADRRLARTRVVVAALLRRLPRCPAYAAWTAERVDVTVAGEPSPLARDGEVGAPVGSVTLRVRPRALVAYRAVPED